MEWIELLKNNEIKIKKAMRKANWDALQNPHLRFCVNMDKDGNVWTEEDVAGGYSISMMRYEGKAIEVADYCYQGFDGNAPLEQHAYIEHLDKMFDDVLELYKESLNV